MMLILLLVSERKCCVRVKQLNIMKYFVLVFLCLEISVRAYYGPVWSYDDEKNWPGIKCKLGGKRQSPIDIKSSMVIKDFNSDFIKYGTLKFKGHQKVLMSGINNGLTIQFNTEGEPEMHPLLTGGPLKHEYRLEQLHFHWLSEHSMNGIKYPMEMHFVHVRSDLSVADALKKKDGLAIIAVFGNVKSELEDKQEEIYEEIMQHFQYLTETGDRVSGVILDLVKLMGPDPESYYTYAGSLTSPQCNEVVTWIIMVNPIVISDAQYRAIGKIGVGRHNFRSLQTINQHKIYSPPSLHIQTPQMIKFLEKVVKIVAEFFKNVTNFMTKGFKHTR